jgi:hypothetical protein
MRMPLALASGGAGLGGRLGFGDGIAGVAVAAGVALGVAEATARHSSVTSCGLNDPTSSVAQLTVRLSPGGSVCGVPASCTVPTSRITAPRG